MKTEHERTTQKHMNNIPNRGEFPVSEGEEQHVKNEDEAYKSHKSQFKL